MSHLVLADTEEEAAAAAEPAWEQYLWNLFTPRRLEAERRGLSEVWGGGEVRPSGLPDRDAGEKYLTNNSSDSSNVQQRPEPGQVVEHGGSAAFRVIAGTPNTVRSYLDEYVATGANYFVCGFHFGNMDSAVAERSIDLFIKEVMPHYLD